MFRDDDSAYLRWIIQIDTPIIIIPCKFCGIPPTCQFSLLSLTALADNSTSEGNEAEGV